MYPPGRQIIYVARTHVIAPEHFGQSLVGHARRIFVRCHLPAEPIQQISSRCSVHHIPHLRLARTAVATLRQLVIRMHLHGKGLGRIDKFDKQGKTCTETFEVPRPTKRFPPFSANCVRVIPSYAPPATTDSLPGMPDSSQLSPISRSSAFNPFEREYAVSSPQGFFEYIRKTEQFIFHIPSVKKSSKITKFIQHKQIKRNI